MGEAVEDVLQSWQWEPQPRAGTFLHKQVTEICRRVPFADVISRRLRDEAGTRLEDMVDVLLLSEADIREAESYGWNATGQIEDGSAIYENPQGQFPHLGLSDQTGLYMKVESVWDFLHAHDLHAEVRGEAHSGRRHAIADQTRDAVFGVIERPAEQDALLGRLAGFQNRNREDFAHVTELVEEAVAKIGTSHASRLFFRAEREYWQKRNRAAQVQKQRQDRLGIGWANHDHHTYRSSRTSFKQLIALFERLGFHCRERFYAGLAAGWGAQILENTDAGLVLFCDVDLSPDELQGDFAHDGLAARKELGTIGLWCGLHGDSILQAGMHHLECTFSFDLLREQLEREQIRSMKPFTDFPHLRQAFTEGERWDVDPRRVHRLLEEGSITEEQAAQFRENGALGSHLENLERNDGFKGFNQTGVSEIIAATDPRRY